MIFMSLLFYSSNSCSVLDAFCCFSVNSLILFYNFFILAWYCLSYLSSSYLIIWCFICYTLNSRKRWISFVFWVSPYILYFMLRSYEFILLEIFSNVVFNSLIYAYDNDFAFYYRTFFAFLIFYAIYFYLRASAFYFLMTSLSLCYIFFSL